MEQYIGECYVCGSAAEKNFDYNRIMYFCPVCGRFQLGVGDKISDLNFNHLASYLAHNRFPVDDFEYRYHTTLNKNACDKYRKKYNLDEAWSAIPVHMDSDMIEKVDYILQYIYKHTPHMGQEITWSDKEAFSTLFVDVFDIPITNSLGAPPARRDEADCWKEAEFVLNYLAKRSFIEFDDNLVSDQKYTIRLAPDGYERVDEIQRNTSNGRAVLVAMQFGDETKPLREAIRKGITEAGYRAVFIDEVQHNKFITPELLKHIRDSKFVVVDLSHGNNGAYFEEGYAMGLGKPVIQLCKHGERLHFDIAQMNTIMWDIESDIPEMLCNRIKATID